MPNGPADTATFQLSNTTAVSNSANTIVGGITFAPGANSFTITASGSLALILSGAGVTNNSGVTQNFVAAPSAAPANAIRLFFKNSATAGSGTFFTMNGGATADGSPGWIFFQDTSSADHGTLPTTGPRSPEPSEGAPRDSPTARLQVTARLLTTAVRLVANSAAIRV